MKKYLSLVVVFLFVTGSLLIIVFRKPVPVYGLVPRNAMTSSAWDNSNQAIENLLKDIRQHPGDLKSKLKLAYAYIQEGRVSGNHNFYDKAALELCEEILAKENTNYEALCAKATVLLSQHHFSEAQPIAEKAIG